MAITDTINQLSQQRLSELQAALSRYQSGGIEGSAIPETQADIASIPQRTQQLLTYANQGLLGENTSSQLLQDYIGGSSLGKQALEEFVTNQKQLQSQNQQLQTYRNQLETQQFGGVGKSLTDALSSTQGDIGNLNQFLGQQEANTFNTQLKPLIQMALGSQGLSDSGAQVELQSKALAQLEQQRQSSMMQAALGARSQIQGLQRSDLLGDIGFRQQSLNNTFDLQRTGITMEFQRQLENQRADLARELANRRGGSSGIGSMIGMGLGAVAGGIAGGPGGAMMGAGLGGMLGGGIEGMTSGGGYGGQAMGNAMPSFFAAGSQMPSSWGSQPQYRRQTTGYSGVGDWAGPTLNGPSSSAAYPWGR